MSTDWRKELLKSMSNEEIDEAVNNVIKLQRESNCRYYHDKMYRIARYKRDPDVPNWLMQDGAETRQKEILCIDCKKWLKFNHELIKELDQPDLGMGHNNTTCGFCEFMDKCDTWFVIHDIKK